MKPIKHGPWTISVGDALGATFKLHHRKNYIPEIHEMHDLVQLARLIRRAEKWSRAVLGKRP